MDKFFLKTSIGDIAYTIKYSIRCRAIKVNLNVSSLSLEVKAPIGYCENEIHKLILGKSDWIVDEINKLTNKEVKKHYLSTTDAEIPYTINYSSRRKTISISIRKSSLIVEIKAPLGYSESKIHKLVSEKQDWIVKNIAQIAEHYKSNPKTEYTDGSQHLFLGELYTLQLSLGHRASVNIEGNTIQLKALKQESVEKVLRAWYRHQAEMLFPEIIAQDVLDFSNQFNRCPSKIEYRYSVSYWGLCNQDMRIKLNIELIKSRKEHISYIMCHELCHLIHRNHSKQFYDLLTQVCPNWKQLKVELNNLVRIR